MMNKEREIFRYIRKYIFLTIFCLHVPFLKASDNKLIKIKSLKGSWKFSIGERDEWISVDYDDSQWENIYVPSSWEDQGFQGYNGYGFYRKQFTLSSEYKDYMLYLILGYIDDVDEVYFNGHKIGNSGSFPPHYETAYNAHRKYYIPDDIINFNGINLIAVKVYDSYQAGGIVRGEIGIYSTSYGIKMDINLQGLWKFHESDDFTWKKPDYNDSNWNKIFVPAKWEDQGCRDYDGYAWYRKSFVYKGNISDAKLVMLLGKIDDGDQVYLNGVLIGQTGEMPNVEGKKISLNNEYDAFRGYYFSTELLKKNQKNVISVRVYDRGGAGGIYEGPVGIVSQAKYIDFWRKRKSMYKK